MFEIGEKVFNIDPKVSGWPLRLRANETGENRPTTLVQLFAHFF